jgi:hypothetical protein
VASAIELPRIKVCGVRSLADIEPALGSGLGLVGFVDHEDSVRYIESAEARTIIRALPRTLLPVIVLVDSTRGHADSMLALDRRSGGPAVRRRAPIEWRDFEFPILRPHPGGGRGREGDRGLARRRRGLRARPSARTGRHGLGGRPRARRAARAPGALPPGRRPGRRERRERGGAGATVGRRCQLALGSAPREKDPVKVLAFVRAAARALAAVHGRRETR